MSKKIDLTQDKIDIIIKEYLNGTHISTIENLCGYSDKVIYKVLKDNGIERTRKNPKLSDLDKKNIAKYREEGHSYAEIIEKFNITKGLLRQALIDTGTIKSFSKEKCQENASKLIKSKSKRAKFDEHIFDVINTPDKAYCIGLFMADGCNLLESNIFSIELQEDDVDILNKIKLLFQSDNKLSFILASGKNNKKKNTYRIHMYSKYFCERLNELGIIPRKSLSLDFPYWMERDLIPFMLKGYIDGDGWYTKYRVGLMSTDKFCIGLKNYLDSINIECHIMDMKRHYNEHTKTLYITGRNNIIPLVETMYSCGNLYFQRKKNKAIELGFLNNMNNSL